MSRRTFLQGLAASAAALLVWGKGSIPEIDDQLTLAGRKSAHVLDNLGIHVRFASSEPAWRYVREVQDATDN